MIEPAQLWQTAGRSGAWIVAVASALIVLALAFAFYGLSMARMPFAAITAAGTFAAAIYAFLMWQAMAVRPDGISLSGALVAGAGAPLIGGFLLDVLQSVYTGSYEAPGGSILLAYWPVAGAALVVGALAGLATAAFVRRRFTHLNRPGIMR